MLHISIAAEKIGTLFFLPVTNSLFMTWFVMVFLIVATFIITRKISMKPSSIQVIGETMIEGLYDLFKSVTGEHVDRFFPLLATIFFFVLIGNWSGLLPGVGSILIQESENSSQLAVGSEQATDVHEEIISPEAVTVETGEEKEHAEPKFIPLLRGPTADLNTTLALALISVLSIQFFGFQILGAHYLGKFFNFKNPILFFVGLLELVSEFTKVVSFSFRLFGNIFAGEVLLTVIAFLMPLIAPLPFIGLEIFVGMIQALVFSMLTAVFLNIATLHEEH